MWLQSLYVEGLRNLKAQSHRFQPGVHAFWGVNGAGKTSCLEAIYLLFTLRSFRTYQLRHLMNHGSDRLVVEGEVVCRGLTHHLHLRLDSKGRHTTMNGKSVQEWYGLFPCSSWTPEDLELIQGPPAYRRRFLDHHLLQVDPLYAHHWTRYMGALAQRGALLKRRSSQGIGIFETQMALSAAYLAKARRSTLAALSVTFQQRLEELEFPGPHHLSYEGTPEEGDPAAYEQLWHRTRPQEMKLGQTLHGPHVDEIRVIFQGQDARRFASQGQSRSCVAALKLAEWQALAQREGDALILVDEWGMGLDAQRLRKITPWILPWSQAFVTLPYISGSAEEEGLYSQWQSWRVEAGSLQLQQGR